MICEETRLALQNLFPEEEIPAPEVVEDELDDESDEKKKKPKKAEPRKNGLVERDYAVHGYHLDAQVAADQVIEAVSILDEKEFFIESITGVDWIKDNELEVVYDFCRYDFDLCRVVIRSRIPRDKPEIPTITEIYAGASWHERETHDFFGIKFIGHPHLVPLLLPEDADFHPLLKDFKA